MLRCSCQRRLQDLVDLSLQPDRWHRLDPRHQQDLLRQSDPWHQSDQQDRWDLPALAVLSLQSRPEDLEDHSLPRDPSHQRDRSRQSNPSCLSDRRGH